MKNTIQLSPLLLLSLLLCTNSSFGRKSSSLSNFVTTIDLELSVTTDNLNIDQWESGTFTFTLENKGFMDATGVEVRLYYIEDVVPVGGAVVNASSGNYSTRSDTQFVNIGLWENINVPVGGTATLQIELFSKVTDLSFCAEVTAADQEDSDSTPTVTGCGSAAEDDQVTFGANTTCSFFQIYDGLAALTDEINVVESQATYSIQSNEIIVNIDKSGNLLSTEMITPEPSSTFSIDTRGSEVQFIKISLEGDTVFNEIFSVAYENPTSIAANRQVFTVSSGLVFGGFLVDTDSDQRFRGFVIKTDLNGQNPRFITLEDIDDTLSPVQLLEDSEGNLYLYWVTGGNYSISQVSADFSSAWVTQFASDTPSTDTEDIKLSVDEQKIYVAVTDNLRSEVYAYDTATGEAVVGGFDLTDWLPITGSSQIYRSNRLLPLDDGNLVFSNQFIGDGSPERLDYHLFNSVGEPIWTQSIEGENYNLRPVAQTNDGGFLFVNRFDPFSRRDEALQILKTTALGALSSDCNTFEADKLIDLELSITSENAFVPIWTSESFTLTLVNNGPDDATDVEVQLAIDNERFVEVGESMPTASMGIYFQGVWSDINLAAGESATLQIDIFNKSEILTLFAQVTQANQVDLDSSPFNAICCLASEDDEAVFVSSRDDANINIEQRGSNINSEIMVYPNPTTAILNLKNIADQTTYQVYDVLGRNLMQGQINSQQIDVRQLESGTYFLNILEGDRTPIRFVKQ
ncbi:MAG: T9SS type A sorting domain-containing protein [Bacteroidota bacterium]